MRAYVGGGAWGICRHGMAAVCRRPRGRAGATTRAEGESKIFFAFGGTAEARLPSILAANASMPPRCRVSHTTAVIGIWGLVVHAQIW